MNKRYSVMEPQSMSIPAEPKEWRWYVHRFRTAKDDIDCVRLITGNVGYDMEKESSRGLFDYYTINWRLNEEPFSLLLSGARGRRVCYYGRCGVSKERKIFYDFRIVPGFSTPDWAKGAVMYQILYRSLL